MSVLRPYFLATGRLVGEEFYPPTGLVHPHSLLERAQGLAEGG